MMYYPSMVSYGNKAQITIIIQIQASNHLPDCHLTNTYAHIHTHPCTQIIMSYKFISNMKVIYIYIRFVGYHKRSLAVKKS